jgi:hypothetical protein
MLVRMNPGTLLSPSVYAFAQPHPACTGDDESITGPNSISGVRLAAAAPTQSARVETVELSLIDRSERSL